MGHAHVIQDLYVIGMGPHEVPLVVQLLRWQDCASAVLCQTVVASAVLSTPQALILRASRPSHLPQVCLDNNGSNTATNKVQCQPSIQTQPSQDVPHTTQWTTPHPMLHTTITHISQKRGEPFRQQLVCVSAAAQGRPRASDLHSDS